MTIPEDLYKTHVKKAENFAVNKRQRSNFFLASNATSYLKSATLFKYNGSATFTSYCYLKCNETLLVTTKRN